jgi:NAD(P)-dependent dehydrogenase (short-subunit alcohol dehydrogenase family)
MRLEGKTAIVTGASAGLGASIVRLYAQEGAKVVAFARRQERLDELAASLVEAPGEVKAFAGDIADRAAIDALFDFTITQFGQVDILVNNAGILDDFYPAADVSDELWDKVIQVNLTSVMWCTRRALKEMLPKESGSIINIASTGGLMGSRAGCAYTASKHGVLGFTKNTAFMYAKSGIRVNAICPGGMMTEIGNNMNPNMFAWGRVSDAMNAAAPRIGEPDEVAPMAVFLGSDEASYVNSALIAIDGGVSGF